MAISVRHNSVEEAARYLRMRPEHIYGMMDRGEIEVLRLGGVDYVALDVISEGNGPRRYQPHPPGAPARPAMPPTSRSRPKRRR
jgi:excisionase family DNA binding protein